MFLTVYEPGLFPIHDVFWLIAGRGVEAAAANRAGWSAVLDDTYDLKKSSSSFSSITYLNPIKQI